MDNNAQCPDNTLRFFHLPRDGMASAAIWRRNRAGQRSWAFGGEVALLIAATHPRRALASLKRRSPYFLFRIFLRTEAVSHALTVLLSAYSLLPLQATLL